MKMNSFDSFFLVKRYSLMKSNQLIDYNKFLKLFNDRSENSISMEFYSK
jgi:hypothetical protein